MRDHPEPPRSPDLRALEWTTAEWLEDGLETRLLLSRGRRVGLAIHSSRRDRPRTVLLGPVADLLGEPASWLDGLDPFEALDRIETAMLDVPLEELDEALAAWAGSDAGVS